MPGAVPRTNTQVAGPAPNPPPSAASKVGPADTLIIPQATAPRVTDTPPSVVAPPVVIPAPVVAPPRAVGAPANRPATMFVASSVQQKSVGVAGAGMGPCPTCGVPVAAGTRFCSQCGTQLDPKAPAPPGAKAAAAIKQTQFMAAFQVQEVLKNKNRLVVLDAQGKESMQYSLQAAQTMCGREHGMMILDDPYVSPAHCVFRVQDKGLSVEDSGSLNGVYVKIREDMPLEVGDMFRVGRTVLRVEEATALSIPTPQRADGDDSKVEGTPVGGPGVRWRLVELLEGGAVGDSRVLRSERMTLGREGCDFPLTDSAASARHGEVSLQAGLLLLRDLGSTNGVFLRLRAEQKLVHGDVLMIGQQRIRVDVRG